MNETYLVINSYGQKASIDPVKLYVKNSSHISRLIVPIRFDFQPMNGRIKFCVFSADVQLSTNQGVLLSKINVPCQFNVYESGYEYIYPEFEIDESILFLIEKERKEEVIFRIYIKIHVGYYSKNYGYDKEGKLKPQLSISKLASSDDLPYIEIKIPQSTWINDFQHKLGYKQYRLIELPAFNDVIPESYKTSLLEIEEAVRYFKISDWDKVVAHSRNAVEPIKKELEILKDIIESRREYLWLKTLNEQTYEWIKKSVESTISLSSKTHHPPSFGHFNKEESQAILMIATSLLAYVGQLKGNPRLNDVEQVENN